MYPYVKTWADHIKPVELRWRTQGFRESVGGARRAMMASTFTVVDAVPVMADLREPVTVALGAVVRLSREIQTADEGVYRLFEAFVDDLLHKGNEDFHVEPLQQEEFLTFEEWLDTTEYTDAEKEELRADNVGVMVLHFRMREMLRRNNCQTAKWKIKRDEEWFDVFGFPKLEFLKQLKVSRGINARKHFRAFYGPFIKSLEKKLFKNKAFVKYVSVVDRADYIRGLLERFGNKYFLGDYSSFEAMFTTKWMMLTSLKWMRYVSRNHPDHQMILEILENVLAGWNRIRYKRFTAFIEAVRMSGEMDTSSANGISNLFFMLFVYYLIWLEEKDKERLIGDSVVAENCYSKNPALVVEGDDSETTGRGRLPCQDDFAQLGFAVTEEVVLDPGEGGFCGILQASDGTLVKDPIWVLSKFCWLEGAKYGRSKEHWKKSLYRAKALSLAHEMPQCPILRPFADAVARLTRAQHNRMDKAAKAVFDSWEYQRYLSIKDKKLDTYQPTMVGRLFLEESFGLTVNIQLQVESRCSKARVLTDLWMDDILGSYCPPVWRVLFADLVHDDEMRSIDLFPSTSANNAAIARLHSLMDPSRKERRPITLKEMLRSCGASQ